MQLWYKKTKQNKTKQNKTKQNKTKQNKTKQNKTKQNKTKQKQKQKKNSKKMYWFVIRMFSGLLTHLAKVEIINHDLALTHKIIII